MCGLLALTQHVSAVNDNGHAAPALFLGCAGDVLPDVLHAGEVEAVPDGYQQVTGP